MFWVLGFGFWVEMEMDGEALSVLSFGGCFED